jgi:hypothetical protein
MSTTTTTTAATDAPAAASAGPAPLSRARRLLTVALAVGVLAVVLAAGAWRLQGGSWFSVRTPSMGQAAPVGTLVLTRPVDITTLAVGDIITFHPPTAPTETFTHRVVTLDPASSTGTGIATGVGVSTQGDINGAPDPWTVHQGDLLGRVTARWWTVGWVVQALPLLLLGALLGWGLTRLLTRLVRRPQWRSPLHVVGASLLVAYTAQQLHPFLGITQIAAVTDAGTTQFSLVSTGILPIRVHTSIPGGPVLDLHSGQPGVLDVLTGNGGRVDLSTGLHMPWPWWLALGTIWLTPLMYTLLVGSLRTAPHQEQTA